MTLLISRRGALKEEGWLLIPPVALPRHCPVSWRYTGAFLRLHPRRQTAQPSGSGSLPSPSLAFLGGNDRPHAGGAQCHHAERRVACYSLEERQGKGVSLKPFTSLFPERLLASCPSNGTRVWSTADSFWRKWNFKTLPNSSKLGFQYLSSPQPALFLILPSSSPLLSCLKISQWNLGCQRRKPNPALGLWTGRWGWGRQREVGAPLRRDPLYSK